MGGPSDSINSENRKEAEYKRCSLHNPLKHVPREISTVASEVTRAAISRAMTVNNKSSDNITSEDYTVVESVSRQPCFLRRKLVKHLQNNIENRNIVI